MKTFKKFIPENDLVTFLDVADCSGIDRQTEFLQDGITKGSIEKQFKSGEIFASDICEKGFPAYRVFWFKTCENSNLHFVCGIALSNRNDLNLLFTGMEQIARAQNCVSITFETKRKGLIEASKVWGSKVVAVCIAKKIDLAILTAILIDLFFINGASGHGMILAAGFSSSKASSTQLSQTNNKQTTQQGGGANSVVLALGAESKDNNVSVTTLDPATVAGAFQFGSEIETQTGQILGQSNQTIQDIADKLATLTANATPQTSAAQSEILAGGSPLSNVSIPNNTVFLGVAGIVALGAIFYFVTHKHNQ